MTSFGLRLLAWFDQNRRDLPWRRRKDAWGIWVSEIMLQQTRVEAVRERYTEFMTRWPEPNAFAAASDDELQRSWQGLGYYRRARLLRDGARAVVELHGGQVPSDPEAIAALPGVGPYTRGAIASIAFAHAEPAVDGNVERVAARHTGIETNVKRQPAAGAVRAFATEHLDSRRPGDFNQALMELGALICTPRSPRCENCPVHADCFALREGDPERLPVLPARKRPVPVRTTLVLIPAAQGLLSWRIPKGEINADQIELPGPGMLADTAPEDVADAIRRRCGAEVTVGEGIGSFRHGITHHRITVDVHIGELTGSKGRLEAFEPGDPDAPWTTPSRKALRRSGHGPAG